MASSPGPPAGSTPDGEHFVPYHPLHHLADPVEEQKRRSFVHRAARLVGGVVVLALGIAMIFLPGPGVLAIAIGLGLLADDVPPARRALDRIKDRLPEGEDGKIAPRVWVVSGVLLAASIGASVWWYTLP